MEQREFRDDERKTLEDIMLHRRDIRGNRFTDEEVSDEVIDTLLTAASHAPSVGFSQPWEFVIIRDPATKEKIVNNFTEENRKGRERFSGKRRELYGELKLEGILEAPVNIAVFYKTPSEAVLGQTSVEDVGAFSVVCAVQNMWLMARALNVGLGWVSILDPSDVCSALNAPKENRLIAYLCVGYVDEFPDTPELETLQWEKRKAMASAVSYESF